MGFGSYLRHSLGDFLFCAIAAGSLLYTACSAFYATQPFQAWPLLLAPLGAATGIVVLLFCVAYTPKTAAIGGTALTLGLAGCLVACALNGAGASPVDDVEGNYFILALLVALSSALTFLVSRTRLGAIVLLVAGVALSGVVEYLYWYGHAVALAAFLVGAGGLAMFRSYQRNLAGSDTEDLAFGSVTVVGLLMTALAVAIGVGVFAAAVEPLDPPRIDVKLIVEHRRAEEVEIVGTGAVTSEEDEESGDLANGEEENASEDTPSQDEQSSQGGMLSLLGMDEDQRGEDGATTALERVAMLLLLVLLAIAAVIAAAVALKKALRRRRFGKMTSGDDASSVRELYLFFLSRFDKMKIPRPDNMSPAAHVSSFAPQFASFEQVDDADGADTGFAALTGIYEEVVYGGREPSASEAEAFKAYYRGFYRNARRYVGRFKYLFKFFSM